MVDAVDEITQGLGAAPATISPKYFYDARGSQIFEQITRLPEYYPTRTEREIMRRHGADIARKLGPGRTVIELGAGNCEKARSLCETIAASRFVAVDISEDFLHESVSRLRAEMPQLDVSAFGADLTHDIVFERLLADMRSKGVAVREPSDPLHDSDFIRALISSYTIAPTTELAPTAA